MYILLYSLFNHIYCPFTIIGKYLLVLSVNTFIDVFIKIVHERFALDNNDKKEA